MLSNLNFLVSILAAVLILSNVNQSAEAQPAIDSLINSQVEKNLYDFKSAKSLYEKGEYDKSLEKLELLKNNKDLSLTDYVLLYQAKNQIKKSNYEEVESLIKKLDELKPNIKLQAEISLEIGRYYLERKKFKESFFHFSKLEKRNRNTDVYPEIIYNLALAEKGLKNRSSYCHWANRLYEKYPQAPIVLSWGPDLVENKIGGEESGCVASLEDFKDRLRSLMLSGLIEKAQNEINLLKSRADKQDPFVFDQIQAQFWLLDSEPQKAKDLLLPYFDLKKRDLSFLQSYASSCARSGDIQTAVAAFYASYKISPHSKYGKQSLFQSAFLSYQFQDYDGASRKFKEFLKVFSDSQLSKDAKWHLAWIKYLKGDFENSFKAFKELKPIKKGKSSRDDKIIYWMAMSLYRQGKYEQAKPYFEYLSKDKLLGFYSIASLGRIRQINSLTNQAIVIKESESNFKIGRFDVNEFLMPTWDVKSSTSVEVEELENDPSSVANSDLETTENIQEKIESTDTGNENPDNQKGVIAEGDLQPSFSKDPKILQRFEKARDLILIGMGDWAKWELYEIERSTRNREYLKILMNEYSNIEFYHRSSYIAQTTFGGDRLRYGIEGARSMWEFSYPKAYSKDVDKYSQLYTVPFEFIWGIMRAESQYKKEAVSPVGALGLMQVMPVTGQKLSRLLKEKDFKSETLLTSEGAIKMGSRYLKKLLDQFGQTIPLAAAAYNAGPHRVSNWLNSFGYLETDEFVEHIPFLETRNYVKKVMSNCVVYNQLYGKKTDLFPYISSQIPVKITGEVATKENWDEL